MSDDEFEFGDFDEECSMHDGSEDHAGGSGAGSGWGAGARTVLPPGRPAGIKRMDSDTGTYSWYCWREADITSVMMTLTADLASVLGIDVDSALVILGRSGWNRERVEEAWWRDDGRTVRRTCHVSDLEDPPPHPHLTPDGTFTCPVTMDDVPATEIDACACGHWASKAAWRGQVEAAMTNPSTALQAHCIECDEAIRPRMFRAHLPPHQIHRFWEGVTRSFADINRHYAFCPAPGCDWVVEYTGGGIVDVACGAYPTVEPPGPHHFCFGCKHMPSHRPCSCEEAAAWSKKDTQEVGASCKFLVEHTKRCPNPACTTRIERTQGCNKVTCTRCGIDFCWNCLRYPFARVHNYPQEAWNCNAPPDPSTFAESERELKMYAWYFERAGNHDETRRFILNQQAELAEVVERTREVCGMTAAEVAFITDTTALLARARNVLKWSYIHAFFLARKIQAAKDRVAATARGTCGAGSVAPSPTAASDRGASPAGRTPSLIQRTMALVSPDASRSVRAARMDDAHTPSTPHTPRPFVPTEDHVTAWTTILTQYCDVQAQLEGYTEIVTNLLDRKQLAANFLPAAMRDAVTSGPGSAKKGVVMTHGAGGDGSAGAGVPSPRDVLIAAASPRLHAAVGGTGDRASAEVQLMALRTTVRNYTTAIRQLSSALIRFVDADYDAGADGAALSGWRAGLD